MECTWDYFENSIRIRPKDFVEYCYLEHRWNHSDYSLSIQEFPWIGMDNSFEHSIRIFRRYLGYSEYRLFDTWYSLDYLSLTFSQSLDHSSLAVLRGLDHSSLAVPKRAPSHWASFYCLKGILVVGLYLACKTSVGHIQATSKALSPRSPFSPEALENPFSSKALEFQGSRQMYIGSLSRKFEKVKNIVGFVELLYPASASSWTLRTALMTSRK